MFPSFPHPLRQLCAAGFLCAVAGPLQAAPVVYYDINPLADGVVGGAPVAQRALFADQLADTLLNTVEYTDSSSSSGYLRLLDDQGQTRNRIDFSDSPSGVGISSNRIYGRYNTTDGGISFLEVDREVTLEFVVAVSAFGLYITDLGDLGGKYQVTLTDEAGIETRMSIPVRSGVKEGALSFWGFIDPSLRYTRVSIRNIVPDGSTGDQDAFGLDDFIVGNLRTQGLPEPGSLALAGLALAAGVVRRKRPPAMAAAGAAPAAAA